MEDQRARELLDELREVISKPMVTKKPVALRIRKQIENETEPEGLIDGIRDLIEVILSMPF